MNNESKKDLIIGMLFALSRQNYLDFNESQIETFNFITKTINEIYYPKPDVGVILPEQSFAAGELARVKK